MIAPLPTAALRIEATLVEQLNSLGLRTIGDLLALPRSTLPARFGSQLVRRLRQALGEVYEELTAQRREPPPTARETFETPLRDFATLLVVVGRLCADLFERLARRSLALHRVDCILTYENATPTVLRVSLSRASRAWKHIEELVRRRLEALGLSDGLLSVQLIAAETSRFEPGQIELFEPTDPNAEEDFDLLVDRLVNRLGAAAVLRAELADDYQPEQSFQWVAAKSRDDASVAPVSNRRQAQVARRIGDSLGRRGVASHESARVRGEFVPARTGRGSSRERDVARPMRLASTPRQIRAIALVPDGPPAWLAIGGREYVIARALGPERIETAWWRGPDVRRDYFRVLAETGEQFWVFRSGTDGRWYLHGEFV